MKRNNSDAMGHRLTEAFITLAALACMDREATRLAIKWIDEDAGCDEPHEKAFREATIAFLP